MTYIPGEQDPRMQLDVVAEWNDSRFVAANWQGLEGNEEYGDIVLLRDNDFESPIQHLAITAQRRVNEGKPACFYNAEIDIEPLEESEWRGFLDYLGAPESNFASIDENMWLEASKHVDHVYYLTAQNKYWLSIEFNPDMPHVSLHTLIEHGTAAGEAANFDEAQITQLYFLTSVMRTVDFVAGLWDQNPAAHRLAKTYLLGNVEPPKEDPSQLPKRLAIEGAKRQVTVRKSPGGTAGRPESLPWHPELEDSKSDKLLFKDIGGMWKIKDALQELVALRKYPDIQAKWGATPANGVFLSGPTGNGKTMLITALANELDAKLISVKGSEIIDKWIGNSEKNLNHKFNQAEHTKGPVVLFFDEADAILMTDMSERSAMVGAFKRRANTLPPHVLLAAASNYPERIDPAILASSRFDLQFSIGDPDEAARADILAQQVELENDLDSMLSQVLGDSQPRHSFRVFDSDLDLLAVARATEGFNGAALANIFKNLRRQKAMEETRQRTSGRAEADIRVAPISQADIRNEIENLRRRGQIH